MCKVQVHLNYAGQGQVRINVRDGINVYVKAKIQVQLQLQVKVQAKVKAYETSKKQVNVDDLFNANVKVLSLIHI